MKLNSHAFENQKPIPAKYTCQGEDISPELIISEIPKKTKSLSLIVDDPDAPHGTFDHWITWDITPVTVIGEGEKIGTQGMNGFGVAGYNGPCPPPGSTHHYHFKLYALDTKLNLPEGSLKGQVLKAMEGHILDQAELIGTFYR